MSFGKIVGATHAVGMNAHAQMQLNEYGTVAYNEWMKLPERFSNFELDVFQIMPNHMHAILVLNKVVGATLAVAPTSPMVAGTEASPVIGRAEASPAPTRNATIGAIVGAYKSLVANGCLDIYKIKNETIGKLWQRNYYEHIIENEQSYQTISTYIINNPSFWGSINSL